MSGPPPPPYRKIRAENDSDLCTLIASFKQAELRTMCGWLEDRLSSPLSTLSDVRRDAMLLALGRGRSDDEKRMILATQVFRLLDPKGQKSV